MALKPNTSANGTDTPLSGTHDGWHITEHVAVPGQLSHEMVA